MSPDQVDRCSFWQLWVACEGYLRSKGAPERMTKEEVAEISDFLDKPPIWA